MRRQRAGQKKKRVERLAEAGGAAEGGGWGESQIMQSPATGFTPSRIPAPVVDPTPTAARR